MGDAPYRGLGRVAYAACAGLLSLVSCGNPLHPPAGYITTYDARTNQMKAAYVREPARVKHPIDGKTFSEGKITFTPGKNGTLSNFPKNAPHQADPISIDDLAQPPATTVTTKTAP